MLVREMIARLQDFPQDAPVQIIDFGRGAIHEVDSEKVIFFPDIKRYSEPAAVVITVNSIPY